MKRTTPFKDAAEFEKDLKDFANKFRLTLAEHSRRISDYFEMTCYNLVIRYYENKGYSLEVKNLQKGDFRFKCSPVGYLEYFSFFKASKTNSNGDKDIIYIFHNATTQSAFDDKVFTTPDIVVSKSDIPDVTTDYYLTKHKLTYISKENLVTFCEAKHLTPFPELMINFIGTVHELKPDCINDVGGDVGSDHIAPSLLISGTFGKPTRRIQKSFERRYFVNFLDNLFDDDSVRLFYSMSQMDMIATLGKKRESSTTYEESDEIL